ncbi:MAG TPA: CotH kinase family protein [Chitinophagales bacterium]|nr:CotH kinase family protein [Chitinophagales bacterium]
MAQKITWLSQLAFTTTIFLTCFFSLSAQTFQGDTGIITDDGLLNYYDLQVSGISPAIDPAFGLISVCINATHTWDDDLVIWLKAPDNTLVELTSHNGWDADDYHNTCFEMSASTSITQGSPPFTGSFIPEGNLGECNNGQNPNGTWQLLIVDEYAFADFGALHQWSISFDAAAAAPAAPLTSSNIPLILINTNGQLISDLFRINATMGIIDNGPGLSNHPEDAPNNFQGNVSIEKRGSSSISFAQSSYSFETEDDTGANLNVSLLGMPEENDWVLYAPYNDKSMMRNALIYRLSNELGRYASRTRFCEVILNNVYQGVYVLEEKIKQDSARVNIAQLKKEDVAGDELTGGYILKIDKYDGEQVDGFTSQYPPCFDPDVWQTIFIQYHDPQPDNITSQQKNYIHAYVDSFEDALLAPTFSDPATGFRKFGDESSFIDFALLNEISKNVDGYRWSSFFYKDKASKNGKLTMGPIWDFNLAFGNADYYKGAYTDEWQWDFPCPFEYDGGLNPFWWQRLLDDSVYYNNLECRWKALRTSVFDLNHINSLIDSFALVLDSAKDRQYVKYPILGTYVWPNAYYPPTYAEEIDTLKNWIAARISWMDGQLQGGCNLIGIEEETETHEITVFPNPLPGHTPMNIVMNFENGTMIKIELHDITGKPLTTIFEGTSTGGKQVAEWKNVTDLSPGCYLLVITNGKGITSEKIIFL